jgi:limonene-1,2-epoxide hydrolase
VERRFHRGGRDPVRVDHERLDRENDRNRADDRDDPIDDDPRPARKTPGDAVERMVTRNVPLGRIVGSNEAEAVTGSSIPALSQIS